MSKYVVVIPSNVFITIEAKDEDEAEHLVSIMQDWEVMDEINEDTITFDKSDCEVVSVIDN